MSRKIVNVQYIHETINTQAFFMALCDDGTAWTKLLGERDEWTPLPRIPDFSIHDAGDAYQ